MVSINTNMAANIASNALTRNERSLSKTMERLATGVRINSAQDDAAGLAIASKMTSQVRGLNQALRNAHDAASMIQVAEGSLSAVAGMYQRMRELAVQAVSDSNTASDRTALNNEDKQLSYEINRVAENTQWNGTNILDATNRYKAFQIGANAGQTVWVDFGDLSAENNITQSAVTAHSGSTVAFATVAIEGAVSSGDRITFKTDKVTAGSNTGAYKTIDLFTADAAAINAGTVGTLTTRALATALGDTITVKISGAGTLRFEAGTSAGGESFSFSDVTINRGINKSPSHTDITTATTALSTIDTAIESVNSWRASLGASMSRLEYAADNLQNIAQNTNAARSRVLDADYAVQTTELARSQIIQQASTEMLAQANQSFQGVLALLRPT